MTQESSQESVTSLLVIEPPANVKSTSSRVVVGRPDAMELKPLPITPEWIISGNPVARAAEHSVNADGWARTGVWDCTAGRFHWHFGCDETLLILDGEVHVTDDHGLMSVLRVGDVGYFPSGSHFVWNVPHYVRKIVFMRREVSALVRGVYALKALIGDVKRGTLGFAKSGIQRLQSRPQS